MLTASAYRRRETILLASLPPSAVRPLVASLALRAAGPNSTMVAVKPRPDEAALLAQDGGHAPDDLHVTLAYLGGYDGSLDALAAVLAPVANAHAPLEGTVAGVGSFGDNGNGHPAIYLPSVPGLIELRVAVTDALVAADQDYGRQHGYLPHMTTDYADEPVTPSPDGIGTPLHFDELLLVRGNAEVVKIPLVGPPPLTAAGEAGSADEAERELQSALNLVEHWRRQLQSARTIGDVTAIEDARRRLADAEKTLKRQIQKTAKKPKVPIDVAGGQPVEPPPAEPVSPSGVAKEVAKSAGKEIGSEEASRIESQAAGRTGDLVKRARDTLLSPLAGASDWLSPAADEIVNVAFLAGAIREQTQPVRDAVVESVMRSSVEGVGVAFDLTNPLAQKVLAQSASQITNIAETTQLNVMRAIKESYDAGLSIPETAKIIRAGMSDATPARARLIARTELAGAVNGGSLAATQIVQDGLGETYYKQWLTAPGAQYPRHEDYEGLDEQTQQLGDYFDVGGNALQFPGDPDGDPGDVCNCRCTLVYLTAEEAADQGIDLGGTSSPPPDATPEEAAVAAPRIALPMMAEPTPRTLYHYAKRADAERISKEGFSPDHVALGGREVLGKGVYFATDEPSAEIYNPFGDHELLTANATATNPFLVEPLPSDVSGPVMMRREIKERTGEDPGTSPAAFTKVLQDHGYDGVEVRMPVPDPNDRAASVRFVSLGGNQLVVFDPSKVTLTTLVTGDPKVAAQAIVNGEKVVLNQSTQIATLIDDLGAIAKDAQEKGLAAPRLNLGDVSVPGTNLFTQDTIGAPRVEMPQLKGVPVPGSLADAMPRDKRGEVDVAPLFYKRLQDEGTKIEFNQTVRVDHLRATQTELDGAKVAGIMDYLEGGGKIEGSIPVTKDGYIVDGHHRWAAEIGLDYKSNADKPWVIQADVVDKDIVSVINEANQFAAEYGIPQASAFKAADQVAETEIGITPFRPGDVAANFYDTAKARQFEADLAPTAKQFGVTITANERTTGVWKSEKEPSYTLRAHDGPDGVARFSAVLRARYDQDGILLFDENPVGASYRWTLHRVDPEAVIPRLTDHGITDATAVGDTVQIVGEEKLAENVEALAKEFRSVVTVSRGELSFVSRGDVPRSIPEIKALHPTVQIEATESERGITLSLIRVPADVQGKGDASRAMDDLLRYADGHGLTVAVTPEPVGSGMTVSALRSWYKRLGFVSNKGTHADLRFTESMIRVPRALPAAALDPYTKSIRAELRRINVQVKKVTAENDDAVKTLALKALMTRRAEMMTLLKTGDIGTEVNALAAELTRLNEKATTGKLTPADQLRIQLLQERNEQLFKIIDTPGITIPRPSAITVKPDASGFKPGELNKYDTSAVISNKLSGMADDAFIEIPPHDVPWDEGATYHVGPSVAWRKDGVVFTKELQVGDANVAAAAASGQHKTESFFKDLPPSLNGRVNEINLFRGSNPSDDHWRQVYPGFTGSAAASSEHVINFFMGGSTVERQTFEHELGHIVGWNGGPPNELAWERAATEDERAQRAMIKIGPDEMIQGVNEGDTHGFFVGARPISQYGSNSFQEDWAESMRLYLLDQRTGSVGTVEGKKYRFAELWPNRAAIFARVLGVPTSLPTPVESPA